VNKAPDAKEKFAAINGAYEILSDPEKRQMFDAGAMDADGNQQVLITSDVPLRTFSLRTSYLPPTGCCFSRSHAAPSLPLVRVSVVPPPLLSQVRVPSGASARKAPCAPRGGAPAACRSRALTREARRASRAGSAGSAAGRASASRGTPTTSSRSLQERLSAALAALPPNRTRLVPCPISTGRGTRRVRSAHGGGRGGGETPLRGPWGRWGDAAFRSCHCSRTAQIVRRLLHVRLVRGEGRGVST